MRLKKARPLRSRASATPIDDQSCQTGGKAVPISAQRKPPTIAVIGFSTAATPRHAGGMSVDG